MRVALVGPFTGESLHSRFTFAPGVTLPPGYPGAPLMAVLARMLVERGHEVAAISTDYSTPVSALHPFRSFRSGSLTAFFCPQRPRSFRSSNGQRGRMLDFFQYERDCLAEAIAEFKPDLIHAHWTYEFAWSALDSRLPTLVTAHDSPRDVLHSMPNLYRLGRYLMARRVLARAQHLTAVSPDLKRHLQRMAPGAIDVVANPIPEALLDGPEASLEAASSRTLLMVLNGWTDLKNGATALKAFQLARREDPSLRLLCFGAGFEPTGEAQRWATRKGLTDNVEFRGPAPNTQIVDAMLNCLALLHPSRLEACCMSIAEAMSVGLPVIGGRATSGVPWQLDDGRAGLLVDVTDSRAMSGAIAAIASDPDRWQTFSRASRVRARQLFASAGVMDRYLSLYAKVLGTPVTSGSIVGPWPMPHRRTS